MKNIILTLFIRVSFGNTEFLGYQLLKDEWLQFQKNISELFEHGEWVYSWGETGFKPAYSRVCVPESNHVLKFLLGNCLLSSSILGYQYSWKPIKHRLQQWSSSLMCRLMDGRNVMFVGDSLQGEFFLSFVSMALSQSIEDERFPNINEENFKKCDTLCKEKACVHSIPVTVHCGESVPSYSISQFGDKHLTLYNPETGRINEWVRSVTEKNFSIIMMNTGAWYINDSQTIGNLNETLHYIYSNNPKVSIMFRNTPPGHENCGSYFRSPPFNLSSAPRQSYKNPAYHWGDIVSQNEAIKEFLGVTFPQVLFIDVFSSTRMRYDSHVSKVDCLHYCIPGPIDEWCIFHFNALLQFFIKFVYKKEIKYENIKIHETPTKVLTMDEGTNFVYENENFVFSNRERHYIGKSGASSKNLGSIWEVYAVPVGEPYCSLNDTIL